MANKWNIQQQGAKRRRSNQNTAKPQASAENKNRRSTDTRANSGKSASKPAAKPTAKPAQQKPQQRTTYYRSGIDKRLRSTADTVARAASQTAQRAKQTPYQRQNSARAQVKTSQIQTVNLPDPHMIRDLTKLPQPGLNGRNLVQQAGAAMLSAQDPRNRYFNLLARHVSLDPREQLQADILAGRSAWGSQMGPRQEKTARQRAAQIVDRAKQADFRRRSQKQTVSDYDRKNLTTAQLDQLREAKQRYDIAKSRGDQAAMARAHQDAELLRSLYGYSGGTAGSEYLSPGLSTTERTSLNDRGETALKQVRMQRQRAVTEEEIARLDRREREIMNAPGFRERTGADIDTARGWGYDANGRRMWAGTAEQGRQDARQGVAALQATGEGAAGGMLYAGQTAARATRDKFERENMSQWIADAANYNHAKTELEFIRDYKRQFGEVPEGYNEMQAQIAFNNAVQARAQLARIQGDVDSLYFDPTVAERLGLPTTREETLGERLLRQAAEHQAEATEGMSGPEAFLTNALISAGQSAPGMALGLVPGVGPALGMAVLGAQAGGSRAYDLRQQGLTAEEAYRAGFVSGGIEALTEKLPLENFARIVKGKGGRSALADVLHQAGLEAEEEAMSYFGNYIADLAQQNPDAHFSWAELLENAGMGAVGGAVFGGVGSFLSPGRTRGNGPATDEAAGRDQDAESQIRIAAAQRLREDAQAYNEMVKAGVWSDAEKEMVKASLNQRYAEIAGQNAGQTSPVANQAPLTQVFEDGMQRNRGRAERAPAASAPTPLAANETPVSVNPVEQAEQMTAEALRATDAEMARRDAVAQLQAETAPNTLPTATQLPPNAETGQQARQPVSRLEGLANTFGESGAANLRAIGGKMSTGQEAFARDFTDVYNQVLGGRSEGQVSRPAGMSDANYFAAVTAAQNDRKTGWDMDILKASRDAGKNANAGVDWRDQYVRQMDRKTARTVDGLAKALGAKVVFAEKGSILTAGGERANAEITGNVVRIEKGNPNPVRMLIGHELTHRMQDVSPESYRAFRDYVMSIPGSMETLERTASLYQRAGAFRRQDNVRQMAMDEVAADYAGALLENSEQLQEFIRRNYENRTMLETIRDFFRDLASKLTGRQKAQADEAVRLLEEAIKEASARVKEIGNTTAQMGVDLATNAAEAEEYGRFSLGGEKAQTANVRRLNEAQKMERDGKTEEEIRQATGWLKGPDGKWRFEIDDSGAEYFKGGDALFRQNHPEYAEYQDLMDKLWTGDLTDEEQARIQKLDEIWGREYGRLSERADSGSATLGDILRHDALFAAYPELRDVRVQFGNLEMGTNGSYNQKTNTITLSKSLQDNPMNTLVHEIQHVIQHIEGFATGSSPEYWDRMRQSGQPIITKGQKNKLKTISKKIFDLRMQNPDFVDDVTDLWVSTPTVKRGKFDHTTKTKEEDPPEWKAYDAKREALEQKYGEEEVSDLIDMLYDRKNLREGIDPSLYGNDMLYWNTAGEVEAREVSARRKMTDEERRKTPPRLGGDDVVFANGARFSISAQTDADYMDAVEAGDMETAQRMVKAPGQEKIYRDEDELRRVWANVGGGRYVAGGEAYTLGGIFNNLKVKIPASSSDTLTVYETPDTSGIVDGKYIIGDYHNAILENGNFVTYDKENKRITVNEAVRNEIAILGGEKEPGVFYRVTNNKKEISLVKSGQMRNSFNHVNEEEELGVSVWDRIIYLNKKYAYKVTGEIVGVGSDGEPVLDPKTIKAVSPIKSIEDLQKQLLAARKKGKQMFKEKYHWTDEQIEQALRGGYKRAYLEDVFDANEIRHSLGTEGYDRARLMRENQQLKEKLDYWRGQVKKSDRTKADPKEVRNLAKSLRTDYSTDMDAGEITQRLQAIYDGIGKDWSYDRAYEEAGKLARDMIEQATSTEDYLYAEYEPMRKFFKDTDLVVTPEMKRAIPDYNEWRKPLFGKLRLKGGEQTNVDQVFQEAVERWPEWFSEEVSSTSLDQLERIAEVMDSVYRRDEINPFEDDMSAPAGYLATEIMDMFWDVPAVKKTFADRAEARLARQIEKTNQAKEQGRERVQAEREKGNARVRAERERGAQRVQAVREQRDRTIAKLRADHKEKYEKALQRARERREQALKKQSERYLTAKKKRSQQQKERELRAKIQRHVKKLSAKLETPTDTKHIPDKLIPLVKTALESINLASKDMKDTKRTQAFEALRKKYQDMETGGSEVVMDPDLIPNISDIIGFADTPIANLGLEDLNTIWQTVRAIEASISTFNKALGRAKFETISHPAFGIRDYLTGRKDRGDYRGPFRQMDKLLNFNMLTPEAYFLRLGNSGKEVFRMLRDAQDRHITIMDQAQRKTREIVGKTDIRKLEKEKHTFTFDGQTVELTTAQIMSLYELMKRQQAVDHVMIGGVRPESVRKGIKDLPPARPWHLTQDQVSEIVDSLTEEQVRLANALQQYMGGTMAELGNEASMEVYGYRKFTEKHYFPISVDKNQTQSDVKNDAVSGTIAGWGSARPVKPNANNAVILRSIFDVYADHITEMANYASWLAPMENLNRLFNFRYKNEAGDLEGSVKEQLEKAFGRNGAAYWKQLQADLNNGVHGRDDSPFSAFMGTYKASAIGANIRVIAQQPTAILRAMDSINPADFVAGMARARIGKFDKTVKQYAPIAIWKDWGYFQQDTGRQMRNVLFNDDTKLQRANSAMMWGAGKADSLSWTAIWNALESETRRKRKDLRPKSKEFYEAVAERFNEVVDHTQVVDGILQRSQIMRSADGLTKMATSFMAEPTKTYNMMLSAIYEARNAKGRERSAAMGKLAKTAFALTASITVNAAAQALVDAIRDDDKDEDYWEKFIQAYFGLEGETRKERIKNGILNGNLEAAFNPLTYIPYLKDIVSQTQGYSVSRMDMDTISRVLKAFTNVEKAMSGEGKNTKQSAWLNLTAEIARFLGVPAANIKRDVQTVLRTFFAGTGNYRMLYEQEKFLYDVTSKNTLAEFSKLILGAERAGDDEAAQAIRQDMIDSGVDAEKLDKKLAELRKKAVTDTEEYQTALAQKTDAYNTMLEASPQFQNFTEDQQTKARGMVEDYAEWQSYGNQVELGEKDQAAFDKMQEAEANHQIDPALYAICVTAFADMHNDKDENGNDIEGQHQQDKVIRFIKALPDLTNDQRSYLYHLKYDSDKNNPWA